MSKIKEFIFKLLKREKYNSETYISYLRAKGMRIGNDTVIYVPNKTLIDQTRPWLIEIGSNVQITEGVTILTHGFDWSVLKGAYGSVLGSSGKVTIGDNVFIGMKSTILKGVTVGNNVIIGANTLVNKDVSSNCVFAGVPGRVIMSLDEYYQKRKNVQYREAAELVREYKKVYKTTPPREKLHEFFWLFTDFNTAKEYPNYEHMMRLGGNYEVTLDRMKKIKPQFGSYEEFLNYVENDYNV